MEPTTTNTPTTLAADQPDPKGIVAVGNWLVWANGDGTIVRLPKPIKIGL